MMQALADNLWLLSYPLKVAGLQAGRKVTVVRLASAQLVIVSTAPFSEEDVAAIKAVGQPSWLVDAMLNHDTFAEQGLAAFPGIPYLGPVGFDLKVHYPVQPLVPPPPEWGDELLALEIQGVPKLRETVLFHAPSRTLIVQDLAFNFPGTESLWSEVMLRAAVGTHHHPGMPRTFKLLRKDRAAFEASLREMMRWDFDRVIVGHGEPIETGGKAKLRTMFSEAGFELTSRVGGRGASLTVNFVDYLSLKAGCETQGREHRLGRDRINEIDEMNGQKNP